MPANGERGVGELGRNVDALMASVEAIHSKLDSLTHTFQTRELAFMQREALEAEIARLTVQVAALQSWQDWAVKLVLAFVVLGVLGAVLQFSLGG